ncbi:pituitary tumor-transforming gene 1 protein-interacting protein [Nematolebias whitei]|uniref:pituitary tumor-transforming gene 1 protein-interacting protein n=1 Tax=Nematolebias whitei TaxID=451745 RepID=UPI00189938F0|nr:pituitary tumor-transforming gene 1 protein-interacting protein [Nematolebias whitei]
MFSSTSLKQSARTSVFCVVFLLFVSLVTQGECQTTSPPPPLSCSAFKNCDSCVPHAKCLWCFATNNCTEYPVTWLLPPASLCPLSQARWGVCWLNFEALIIALAVLSGTILVSIVICCCCCCCRNHSSRPDRDEERFARRREEIKQRSEQRKVERKARHNEIRRKYGLMGDSDHPYSKFENE